MAATAGPPKFTVIVPVFNPGPYLERLVSSLLGQTLPSEEFEVVLVDDGSTDGAEDQLDRLAEQHPNFRILHIPNSGWPGRPRNLGLDLAVGEFVFFVDQDDYLGAQSLDRAYRHAIEFGSDVIVAKEVGQGRGIPFALFRQTVASASLDTDPLLDMLTPHKIFRRAFLLEHGIRFPEGRRRLEDHLFVVTSYFKASTISIIADYDYYHWTKRDDRQSASSGRLEPVGYFGNLEEVLDVVEANTEPGPARDRLLRRWYASKVLGRLGGRALLGMRPEYRETFFQTVRDLAERRFGPGVDELLSPKDRVRSALLRGDRMDELLRLAAAEQGLRGTIKLEALRWDGDCLVLHVEAGLQYRDGSSVCFLPGDAGLQWVPPVDLAPPIVTSKVLAADAAFARSELDGAVRGRRGGAVYALPTTFELSMLDLVNAQLTPRLRGTIWLDPATAMGGQRLGTVTDVLVRFNIAGWEIKQQVGANRSQQASAGLQTRTIGKRTVCPYWTESLGNLAIRTGPAQLTPRPAVVRVVRSAARRVRRMIPGT